MGQHLARIALACPRRNCIPTVATVVQEPQPDDTSSLTAKQTGNTSPLSRGPFAGDESNVNHPPIQKHEASSNSRQAGRHDPGPHDSASPSNTLAPNHEAVG